MFNIFKKKTTSSKFKYIDDIITKINSSLNYVYSSNDISGNSEYENLKKESKTYQKQYIIDSVNYIEEILNKEFENQQKLIKKRDNNIYRYRLTAFAILNGLMRRNLDYTEKEWISLFELVNEKIKTLNRDSYGFSLNDFPVNYAIQQIERTIKKVGLSDELSTFIKSMLEWNTLIDTNNSYWGSDLKKSVSKLSKIIQTDGEFVPFVLKTNDIGDEVNSIVKIKDKNVNELHQLLYLTYDATSSKPSKKFQTQTEKLINAIGKNKYRKIAQEILSIAISHPISEKTETYTYSNEVREYKQYSYLCDPSKQFIKGIVWTMSPFSDKETLQILSKLLEKSYTKMPGVGPAAAAIGNACIYVMGNMRGKDGLGALSRIKLKLKQNNVKKSIDKYLVEGAKKYNVSVEELKEMAVPDFQLENGVKSVSFEDYSLNIFIAESKINQQWIKPDGNSIKSVPSTVKNSTKLTNQLKDIRKEVKEIQKVYSAQKQRIDNQFILNRSWDFPSFKKYYLNHGLVTPIATKLIWTFQNETQSISVLWIDNTWQNAHGEIIDWVDDKCTVQLWHPVFATEKEIVDWRDKIIALELKQPIKQAFRELYILTDAEINTQTYSNRMAAHILKQHQFNALAGLRGWKYSLMGAYDDGRDDELCSKYLPEHQITAEYWIDELNDHDAFNDAGIWLYVATDQVKFKNADGHIMNLIDVPKIVFSEIMRDVDLFVGVCSVGNDPEWQDNNGDRQMHRDYWTSYSFGDLTEIAKTRKSILERLLPRLNKIKDKTTIDGKFLIVQGTIRTYKIHIGSGNILMEPNDQYLCIVPSRSPNKSTEKLFIPFEGDKGLSIVLSKAFLLAEDTKITDPTILSQITRN
ncbi:DUF4132 domain-containing protein [Lacinutrix sp. C3R15]|uniref:DUF4132 domain-containing protein n=1 Tax=Flavobacteriaceae TaxID=49546 RepID=UPI001C0A5AB4|nr:MULTISPECIES: DUF4132 domain-containing protein [Flavobacteriaceae]MBU2939722.1 DUF4132 domain-containing protein [Lacinutrix sp. C3R15]MDO6623037.1 DUF4132 domain-containing protein [Oceanihabitans sp. 1_MG-2023]